MVSGQRTQEKRTDCAMCASKARLKVYIYVFNKPDYKWQEMPKMETSFFF